MNYVYGSVPVEITVVAAAEPENPGTSDNDGNTDTTGQVTGTWKHNNIGWWWQWTDGSYPVSSWGLINGSWYYFDSIGYMASGWQYINGYWYYLGTANDGSMKTGWQYINGSWYYMYGDGSMAANAWIGGYYVNGSGAWVKQKQLARWVLQGSRWWYRHGDGSYAANAWERIDGSWYYFDAQGWMCSGWQYINGSWYYLGTANDGSMKANTWIGDYYVGSGGAMLTNTWVGNYYVGADGKWVPGK